MSNYQFFQSLNTIDSNINIKSFVDKKMVIKHYNPFGEKKLQLNHNKNFSSQPTKICKQNEVPLVLKSAFDRAKEETLKTEQRVKIHNLEKQKRDEAFANMVNEKHLNEELMAEEEKNQLEKELIDIIKIALQFNKHNNPLAAMMNGKLAEQYEKFAKTRKLSKKKNSSFMSLSNFSLNISNASKGSYVKYESNQFLKLLGLDLEKLSPDNIHINIDQAMEFIKKWRITDKQKLRELIKKKVVYEIANVEERRSVQKLKKINLKLMELEEKKYLIRPKSITNKKSIRNREKANLHSNLATTNADKTGESMYQNQITTTVTNSVNLKPGNIYSQNNLSKTINSSAINESTKAKTIASEKNKSSICDNISVKYHKKQKNNLDHTSKDYNINTSCDKEILAKLTKDNLPKKKNLSTYLVKTRYAFGSSKNAKKKETSKGKIKYLYNSYHDSPEIYEYIKSSKNLKTNDNLLSHFNNLKESKTVDNLVEVAINKNKLEYSLFGLIDEIILK